MRKERCQQKKIAEVHDYEEALEQYLQGNFAKAATMFTYIMQRYPEDSAVKVMVERTEHLQNEPPASWNGVFVMKHKS